MRSLRFIIPVILLSVLLLGCQSPAAPAGITDDLGRQVKLDKIPQRIVSLSPSNTEILFALGLDNQIIGVTTYCNYPPAALSKPKVAEFSKVDIEKIIATGTDLVLADDIHKDTAIPGLEKACIPVLTISPGTLDRLLSDIRLVGEATGKKQEATDLASALEKRIQTVTNNANALPAAGKSTVFFLTWHDPLWTAGANTMIEDLIEKAGGDNIARDLTGYSTINLETIIQRNPQVMIIMGMGDLKENQSYQFVMNEPRLKVVDAVKNGRVYIINSDIFGRTTPRIVDGLEELVKMLHPGSGK